VPGSGQTGLRAKRVGCFPNLAGSRAPSALGYETARPGSLTPGRQERSFWGPRAIDVEPRLLPGRRTGRLGNRSLLATSPQLTPPRTRIWRARGESSVRSGQEIKS